MLNDYIDSLASAGKVAFTQREALQALGRSSQAFAQAIYRLKKQGKLVTPYRDFYVPLPPEYRKLGCLPADQLLPPLMRHVGTNYYACLLSAALIYGAAHQRPQITQVMVPKRMRPIHCGSVVIKFIYCRDLIDTPIEGITVRTGYLNVSSREATIRDLLLYPRQSGGINNIATILAELIEFIEPKKMLAIATSSNECAWVQRLGYLLEIIEGVESPPRDECIRLLQEYIQEQNPSYIPLISKSIKGYPRNKIWRVIANTTVESDV